MTELWSSPPIVAMTARMSGSANAALMSRGPGLRRGIERPRRGVLHPRVAVETRDFLKSWCCDTSTTRSC